MVASCTVLLSLPPLVQARLEPERRQRPLGRPVALDELEEHKVSVRGVALHLGWDASDSRVGTPVEWARLEVRTRWAGLRFGRGVGGGGGVAASTVGFR